MSHNAKFSLRLQGCKWSGGSSRFPQDRKEKRLLIMHKTKFESSFPHKMGI